MPIVVCAAACTEALLPGSIEPNAAKHCRGYHSCCGSSYRVYPSPAYYRRFVAESGESPTKLQYGHNKADAQPLAHEHNYIIFLGVMLDGCMTGI